MTWASCYSSFSPDLDPVQYHVMNRLALSTTPLNIGLIPLTNEQPMSPLSDLDDQSDDMDITEGSSSNLTQPIPAVYVIETKYDPKCDLNTISKCPRNKNTRDIYYATQKERQLAKRAKVAVSLDDLGKKVRIL